jgi:hypothetical protein
MPCIRENRSLIVIQVKDLLPTEKLYMIAPYRTLRKTKKKKNPYNLSLTYV